MKPIVHVPQDVLVTPAKPVTSFDDKLAKLIKDMEETLLATVNPKGVGLAATQVGGKSAGVPHQTYTESKNSRVHQPGNSQ